MDPKYLEDRAQGACVENARLGAHRNAARRPWSSCARWISRPCTPSWNDFKASARRPAWLCRGAEMFQEAEAIINMFDCNNPDMAVVPDSAEVFLQALPRTRMSSATPCSWVGRPQNSSGQGTTRRRACIGCVMLCLMPYGRLLARSGRPSRETTSTSTWMQPSQMPGRSYCHGKPKDQLKYSMHLILTDTEGGLPVVCGARKQLGYDGRSITVDGRPLSQAVKASDI